MTKWAEGQLGGEVAAGVAVGVVVGAAIVIEAAIAAVIKNKEGDIWDKEALDALFNEII